MSALDTIDFAIECVRKSSPGFVIVVDDFDRENEGDLIGAASTVTPSCIATVVRHSTGIVCVSLGADAAAALSLRAMVPENADPYGTAFTVTVDARAGTTTGVSASDRAVTIRALASGAAGGAGAAVADDFTRPGHVFPLVARSGGVLARDGHTEASLDLVSLAACGRAAFLAEVVSDDVPGGGMAKLPELRALAARHSTALISIADLVRHRARREVLVSPTGGARFAARWSTASYAASVHGTGSAITALLIFWSSAVRGGIDASGGEPDDARRKRVIAAAVSAAAGAGGALLVLDATSGVGGGDESTNSPLFSNAPRRAAATFAPPLVPTENDQETPREPPSALSGLYPPPLSVGGDEDSGEGGVRREAAKSSALCSRATAEATQAAAAVLRALTRSAEAAAVESAGAGEDAVAAPRLLMEPLPALPTLDASCADADGGFPDEASLLTHARALWPRVQLLLHAAEHAPPAVWQYGISVDRVMALNV